MRWVPYFLLLESYFEFFDRRCFISVPCCYSTLKSRSLFLNDDSLLHSQSGKSVIFHLCGKKLHRPYLVSIQFSAVQYRAWFRLNPRTVSRGANEWMISYVHMFVLTHLWAITKPNLLIKSWKKTKPILISFYPIPLRKG